MAEYESQVSNFYQDKSILITGGTGFIGKVLIEKLLRSCSDIKTIYLLLRPKKDHGVKERLEELLKAKLFERVKNEQPGAISKLVAIHGDVTSAGLGITSADENVLIENVSIVFHSAATINFDEILKRSVDLNVLGTRRLVELCRKMKQLEALVHVSTVYCNCDRKEIEEVVYPLPVPPQKIIDTLEWMDDDLVRVMTPHLIGERPNTYTYTKALAEALLMEEGCGLPIAIVRPSIVTASWKEPVPGWVDNYNGPTGLFAAISKGLIRSVYCKASCTCDVIPVDVVINLLISVAWYTASHRPRNILVYNSSSGNINKISWEGIRRFGLQGVVRYPSQEIFGYPGFIFYNSKTLNFLSVMLYHYIPATFIDLVFVLTCRKRMFVRLYKKLHRALERFEYFLIHEWTFSTKNVLMLQETLSPFDRKEFNFNVATLHWPSYVEDYALGIRQFLFKEEASSLPLGRKQLRRFFLYKRLSQFAILFILWKLLTMVFGNIL